MTVFSGDVGTWGEHQAAPQQGPEAWAASGCPSEWASPLVPSQDSRGEWRADAPSQSTVGHLYRGDASHREERGSKSTRTRKGPESAQCSKPNQLETRSLL